MLPTEITTTTETTTTSEPAVKVTAWAAVILVSVVAVLISIVAFRWSIGNEIRVTLEGRQLVLPDGTLTEPEELSVLVDLGVAGRIAASLIASGFAVALGGVLIGGLEATRKVVTETKSVTRKSTEAAIAAEAEVAEVGAIAKMAAAVIEPLAKAKPATAALIVGLLLASAGAFVSWQNAQVAQSIFESDTLAPPSAVTTTTMAPPDDPDPADSVDP